MGKLQSGERPKDQGDRTAFASCLLPSARRSPFTFSLLLLAGCTSLNQAVGNDPLLGGLAVRPSAPTAPPPPTPVAALPPPAPNSVLSNAALAAGAPRPLDRGRDLRIGSPRGSAGNDGWAREGSGGKDPESEIRRTADGNGVILRPPEPAAEPVPRRDLTTVSVPGSARESRGSTFEQAQAQMATRGVIWQRLEMVGESGEWKYSCSIPNRQNPRIRRTYQATAGDSVAAIRAVLDQLDKEQ